VGDARSVRTPKYRLIQEELTFRINSGLYEPGTALPPQRELAESLGVTLTTLRQALRELEHRGLVEQQPGRGTFVQPRQVTYRPGQLSSLSGDLSLQGVKLITTVRHVRMVKLSTALADVMGLIVGERVLRLERVRTVGGRPAVHQVSWIPEPYADRVRDTDFSTVPLYAALVAAGAELADASEAIRPGVLSRTQAEILGGRAGGAIFRSERLTRGPDGSVLVLDRAVLMGQYFHIRSEVGPVQSSVRWNVG
jgi:GntR family transcriptional regulator